MQHHREGMRHWLQSLTLGGAVPVHFWRTLKPNLASSHSEDPAVEWLRSGLRLCVITAFESQCSFHQISNHQYEFFHWVPSSISHSAYDMNLNVSTLSSSCSFIFFYFFPLLLALCSLSSLMFWFHFASFALGTWCQLMFSLSVISFLFHNIIES